MSTASEQKKLTILTFPEHQSLREKCENIEKFTDEHRDQLEQMVQLMVEHDGCGLAAPQVGIQLRMLVMNHMRIFSRPDLTFRFINPVIINRFGGTSLLEEGCLSLPGTRVKVRRPRKVKFEAWLPDGTLFQNTFTGFPARVLQHEVDHLDGKLIIDYRDAETG